MLCCCEYPENAAFPAIRHASWVRCTDFCRLLVCKSGSSRLEASQKNKWGKGRPGWLLVKPFCWKQALRQLFLFYDVFVSGLGPFPTSASFEIFFALNIAFLVYREAQLREHLSKKKAFLSPASRVLASHSVYFRLLTLLAAVGLPVPGFFEH